MQLSTYLLRVEQRHDVSDDGDATLLQQLMQANDELQRCNQQVTRLSHCNVGIMLAVILAD